MTARFVIATAALALALVPAQAAKVKRHRAVPPPQQQIACTVIGCIPVPPECGQTTGRTRGGMPTGFDVIVCPPGVAPVR